MGSPNKFVKRLEAAYDNIGKEIFDKLLKSCTLQDPNEVKKKNNSLNRYVSANTEDTLLLYDDCITQDSVQGRASFKLQEQQFKLKKAFQKVIGMKFDRRFLKEDIGEKRYAKIIRCMKSKYEDLLDEMKITAELCGIEDQGMTARNLEVVSWIDRFRKEDMAKKFEDLEKIN